MKRIISTIALILVIKIASAQLDTVRLRHTAFRAETWAVIVGMVPDVNRDSTTASEFRKIQTKIKATPNIQWSTVVSVDSLQGNTGQWIYETFKNHKAGVVVSIYSEVINELNAKANLSPYLTPINTPLSDEFLRLRARGKNIAMDN